MTLKKLTMMDGWRHEVVKGGCLHIPVCLHSVATQYLDRYLLIRGKSIRCYSAPFFNFAF